jgi:hypothetical protein
MKPTVEQLNRRKRMNGQQQPQQNQPQPLNPDEPIADFSLVNLTVTDLNKIMAGLGNLPFKDVIGLVRKIEEQINTYNLNLQRRQAEEQAAQAQKGLEQAAAEAADVKPKVEGEPATA